MKHVLLLVPFLTVAALAQDPETPVPPAGGPLPAAAAVRAVLVTGASSGIGKKTAELLAANGFFVYATARKDDDLRALGPDARYRAISEELLRFAIENRMRMVLLLGKADGTEYERYPDAIVRELVRQAIAWAASNRASVPSAAAHFVLEQLYRNFVDALAHILAHYQREAPIREAVQALSAYHLAGLRAFFLEEAK